uniref:Transmembrane 9 super member 2 n=1 Tax=Sphaerodactylus townsendi TaxID=933632 RepID=A0ACB8FJI9_9SAUR
MGGILPFGCIFIQLFFIQNSIWSHQTYYMFGFLFLVFIILVITCSEATILLCYFHLCAEGTITGSGAAPHQWLHCCLLSYICSTLFLLQTSNYG